MHACSKGTLMSREGAPENAYLWSVQSHGEAPAVGQVGANGLGAAEGVGMVIYGDSLVMLR